MERENQKKNMKLVKACLLTICLYACDAQDTAVVQPVDEESYPAQMMHKEVHNAPMEGNETTKRARATTNILTR
jgi:hypothetical protein